MAIHRGIQSAIFFYLSCAPCAEARYRKKRKQEAVWNRAERDALEEEMPDMYRHPEPSSTNPYWQSEIALGPTLVSRGRNGGNRGKQAGAAERKASREVLSSNTSMAGASSLDLNTMQREDERLWGSEGGGMLDGAGGSATIQRPQRAARRRGMSNETSTTAGTTTSAAAYSNYRSPPVSELLPPIVRTVHSREEVAWMMQPPPVADVMSGKREAGAGRSGASSRQSSAKMARTVSRGSSGGASSVLHVVGGSPRTSPADLRRPSSRGGDIPETIIPGLPLIRRVASRPPLLSTIVSDENVPSVEDEGHLSLIDSAKSHQTPKARNRARSTSDPKTGRVLKGRIFTATESPSDSPSHTSTTSPDKIFYHEGGGVRDDGLFDSWYMPDFELGRWVHEHTRREGIRERWSFDV